MFCDRTSVPHGWTFFGQGRVFKCSKNILTFILDSPLPSTMNTHTLQSSGGCEINDQICLAEWEESVILFLIITITVFVGLILVANVSTFFKCLKALIFSQRKHLQSTIAKLDLVKSEGNFY